MVEVSLMCAVQYGSHTWLLKTSHVDNETEEQNFKFPFFGGHLGGSVVEHLPLARGVIPGPWYQVPHHAPHREPVLPLPMSLPLSTCVS